MRRSLAALALLASALGLGAANATCGGFAPEAALSHPGLLNALALDGQFLCSGSADGTVRVWDLEAGLAPYRTLQADGSVVNALSLGEGVLAIGTSAGSLIALDAARGTFEPLAPAARAGSPVTAVLVHAGRLYAGTWDGQVLVYALPGLVRRAAFRAHASTVTDLATDGALIYSSSKDNTARAWELGSLAPAGTLSGHLGNVYRAVPRGGLVYTASHDGAVGVWLGWHVAAVLEGPGAPAMALAADEGIVVAGYAGGLVKVWDAPSRRPLAALPAHAGDVHAVALDGRRVYSAAWDGTVRVWSRPQACGDGECGACERGSCCRDCGCPPGSRCVRDRCCPSGVRCCESDEHCSAGERCAEGSCRTASEGADACAHGGCATPLPDGSECGTGGQCASGSCDGGRCCPRGPLLARMACRGGAALAGALAVAAAAAALACIKLVGPARRHPQERAAEPSGGADGSAPFDGRQGRWAAAEAALQMGQGRPRPASRARGSRSRGRGRPPGSG